MTVSSLRQAVAESFVNRVIALSMSGARRKQEAKAWFLGAEVALKEAGDAVAAESMREAYCVIVENGFKPVLKWSGLEMPVEEIEAEVKEAA